jgi:hypothetical protein
MRLAGYFRVIHEESDSELRAYCRNPPRAAAILARRDERHHRKIGLIELRLESAEGQLPSKAVVASIASDCRYARRLAA